VTTVLLGIAVGVLAVALACERYCRQRDFRIYRGLLADEGAHLRILIRQLQHHAIGVEAAVAETRSALMYLTWRLAQRGLVDATDAPDTTNDVTH
jgi:hypothetical protein